MAKSLIQQLKELPEPKARCWFDDLTDAQQKELTEFVKAWHAGRWRDKLPRKAHLVRFIQSQSYVKGGKHGVANFIDKQAPDGTR